METASTNRIDVGPSDSVAEAGRLVVTAGGREVGIFRVEGALFAYENTCAHQGGPVCQGRILPRIVETLNPDMTSTGLFFDRTDMHIICPWHGYEYSITTGRHAGAESVGLIKVGVAEQNGRIYVDV
jgi:nitrite reductase/ring-hydroxylating ferredoxin subunit